MKIRTLLIIIFSDQIYFCFKLRNPELGPASLHEFDMATVSMLRVRLARARNQCAALHGVLRAKIDHLTKVVGIESEGVNKGAQKVTEKHPMWYFM